MNIWKSAVLIPLISALAWCLVLAVACDDDDDDNDGNNDMSTYSPENCDYVCDVLFECDSFPPSSQEACLEICDDWLNSYEKNCRACVINCLHVWEDTSCDENEYNNCLNSCYYNCS